MNALEFLNDIKTLVLGDLRHKCNNHISNVTIREIVEAINLSAGGLNQLVGSWRCDFSDRGGMYLIFNHGKYEVLGKSDRGGKGGLRVFLTLEDAAFDYFDRYFNELEYAAPDSMINAPLREEGDDAS